MSFQQEAVREWVWEVGRQHKNRMWLLTDYDTWERNPHYTGPVQPHPEDDSQYVEEDVASRHVQWLQQQDLDEGPGEYFHDSLERSCDEPFEMEPDDCF